MPAYCKKEILFCTLYIEIHIIMLTKNTSMYTYYVSPAPCLNQHEYNSLSSV